MQTGHSSGSARAGDSEHGASSAALARGRFLLAAALEGLDIQSQCTPDSQTYAVAGQISGYQRSMPGLAHVWNVHTRSHAMLHVTVNHEAYAV